MGNTKDLDLEILGDNVRRLRRLYKLNQHVLAHKVGVHANTIKSIESGKNEGNYTTRKAIADLFKVRLFELYQGPPSESARPDTSTLLDAAKILEVLGRRGPVTRLGVLFLLTRDEQYADRLRALGAGPIALGLSKLPKVL